MVVPAATVAVTSTKGLWYSALWLFKFGFWFIIIGLIVLNSISRGIEEKSVGVVLLDLGERTLLATNNLNEESKHLIENDGFCSGEGAFDCIKHFSGFLTALIIVLAWLKVLAFIIARTPFSNVSNWFINYSMAFILFVTLQILIIMASMGISGTIISWFGTENSAISAISTPFRSFGNFVKALPKVIRPITSRLENIGSN